MPLHRHECDACGNRFRVLALPGAEEETPTCPVCGSAATRRLMPLVAVQFKGSGFYKTDHGRSGRGRAGKDASDGDSKGSVSGDARPASESKARAGAKDSASAKASSDE